MIARWLFPFFVCLFGLFNSKACTENEEGSEAVFYRYLDALKSENWEAAESCWLSSDIEKAQRLDITYDGISNKYDCASPLVRTLDDIRNGYVGVSLADLDEFKDHAKLTINLTAVSDSTTVHYYSVKTDDGWRLSPPCHVLTRDWKVINSAYARIHFTDSSRINSIACQSLDDFIEYAGRTLALSPEDMARLADRKIDYYLCDESQIKELTGFDTEGITDLPADAVITRHLPHKHEVTHLLMNYALKNIPLYTSPFMQEGIACHLGGRWGRSSDVIAYAGYAVLKYELANLEDILTFDGFHYIIGSPDVSYPISALFVNYLIEEIGMAKFKGIYRNLSGPIQDIRRLSVDSVCAIIESAWGKSWDDIENGFNLWYPKYAEAGLRRLSEEPAEMVSKKTHDNGGITAILERDSATCLFVDLGDKKSGGFLLLAGPDQESPGAYVSRLFEQHLPGEEYHGERYGIRLSPEEIGVYDYFCNELVASFIVSFSENFDPSSMTGPNAENSRYFISIAKSALDIDEDSNPARRLISF